MKSSTAFRRFAMIAFSFWLSPAMAHKASDAYLNLSINGTQVDGQWDISLRDLDFAIGLDANRDSQITWSEVKRRLADIEAYALARFELAADEKACDVSVSDRLIDSHSDGGYVVLRLSGTCSHEPQKLSVTYRLFADIDQLHRGLLKLQASNATQSAVFSPQASKQTFSSAEPSVWSQLANFLIVGVAHIWTGYDHILFLLSLLLPAALVSRAGGWSPGDKFSAALVDVLRIVTSFTIAHSITLALATLEIVVIPARISESAIALSVILAALNNIYPLIRGRRWLVAAVFGLVHGFGFANTLAELGLSETSLAFALAGFNLGVEAGQVTIVALFLPIAWGLRMTWLYRRLIMVGGSYSVAAIAALWFIERSLNLSFLPVH